MRNNTNYLGNKNALQHGGTGTPEYRAWRSMRNRCLNANAQDYAQYGGRGITICPEWDDFSTFIMDLGPRPNGYSLDRIDTDGNYTPENCRWATRKEQTRNRRMTRQVSLGELAEAFGIPHRLLTARLYLGWDIKRALTQPHRRISNHESESHQ